MQKRINKLELAATYAQTTEIDGRPSDLIAKIRSSLGALIRGQRKESYQIDETLTKRRFHLYTHTQELIVSFLFHGHSKKWYLSDMDVIG